MRLGIVSDTHGMIHPRVFDYLEGVDMMLHAGDIGGEDIIAELEAIAPVTAVFGNVDLFPLTERCKAKEILEINGKKIYLTHRVYEGSYRIPLAMKDISDIRPDIVVFGHTHRQYAEFEDGILFFNPGSAGQQRPGTRMGVGIISLEGGAIDYETHYID